MNYEGVYMGNMRSHVEWYIWTGEEDAGYIFQMLVSRFPDLTLDYVEEVMDYMQSGGNPL